MSQKLQLSWKTATEKERNAFFDELSAQLGKLKIPTEAVNCQNVCCDHTGHRHKCDEYIMDILHLMEKVATERLPTPKRRKDNDISKNIPRWNENIQPFRDNALFWNAIRISAGKPLNTELHKIMKHTRNIYHAHIRKNKRMLDKIKRNALLNACLNGKNGIFCEI